MPAARLPSEAKTLPWPKLPRLTVWRLDAKRRVHLPPASAGQDREDWAILLAITTVLVAITLTAGHWFWQRNRARKARADDT